MINRKVSYDDRTQNILTMSSSSSSSSSSSHNGGNDLSELEKQRYDRQIRVWGAEAQSRIQTSRVLIVGLRGLNVEVVKNIVLAGMNVVIQDSENVQFRDLSSNFFLTVNDVGKKTIEAALSRIQELNTYTTVAAETRSLDELGDDFFSGFSVVVMHDCSKTQALRLNSLCRSSSPSQSVFFLSGTFGLEAWFVADFGVDFKYKNDPPNNKEIKSKSFPSLRAVFEQPWNSVKSRMFNISPTYVKSRILRTFIDKYGRYPTNTTTTDDLGLLKAITSELLVANGMAGDEGFLASLNLDTLPLIATAENVMVCSTLGSFLAQEVIKGVSLSGEPGFNVFVCNGDDCSVKAIPMTGISTN